jgi:SAM-dependent methyltransferase
MKTIIANLIDIIQKNNLGRKGVKNRIKNIKKTKYGKDWQNVDSNFYNRIYNYRPLLHKNFIEYLESKNNIKTVLEIGCGAGTYPIELKHLFKGKEYVGIDIGKPSIEYCKKHSSFNFICGDVINMEFESKFDLVFSHSVIDHVYDIEKFLDKILKITKKFAYISAYRGYFPELKEHRMTWNNEGGVYFNDLSLQQLNTFFIDKGLSDKEFKIRKQEDGTELNQNHSIGLDGYETVIEIDRT